MTPRVSVLLPVFNGGEHLAAALESILAQSLHDFELIVINDGSTDSTAQILEVYAKRDPRVMVFQQPNTGIVRALNKGLELSRGRYIARMDADDIAISDRLKIQVRFMEEHTNTVVCGSNYIRFGDRKGLVRTPGSDSECRGLLVIESCFAHPTVMLKSQVLKDCGIAYREDSLFSEDYRLWSDLSECGELANIQQPLLYYRVHAGQISAKRKAIQRVVHAEIAESNLLRAGVFFSKERVGDVLWPSGKGVEPAIRYLKTVKQFRKLLKSSKLQNPFLNRRLSRIKNKNLGKILIGTHT